ncbi:MAG: hypothetical protein M3Y36_10655, partial [Actinomycetota bacterium]|nr:hypothetical protein [Actinomycetota bacterium]
QAHLAGEEMRRLSRRRQEVISAVADGAWRLSQDLGRPVSDSTQREVTETLEAAMADAAAADVVRSGMLTTALQYAGFGPVDLRGALAAEPLTKTPESFTKTPEPAPERAEPLPPKAEKAQKAQKAAPAPPGADGHGEARRRVGRRRPGRGRAPAAG